MNADCENSPYDLLSEFGLTVQQQAPIDVYFRKWRVGEYFADLLVEDKIIVELKATKILAEEHEYQLINYLKATKIELGLLLNFGKTPEFTRKIFSNISRIETRMTRIVRTNADNRIQHHKIFSKTNPRKSASSAFPFT